MVGMGECRVSYAPGDVLVTYGLGSCIAVAMHDPDAQVGGLLHFMLPAASLDPVAARLNPFKFADTGIPSLLQAMYSSGASRRRLIVSAAGGAAMAEGSELFDIGKRNEVAMRDILRRLAIPLGATATGGRHFRSMKLEIGTGRLWLVEGAAGKRLLGKQHITSGGAEAYGPKPKNTRPDC